MFPSGSRLTMEGQRVEPCGPTIHFGCFVCGSRYATRLLVVPRSIPTIFPISAKPLKAFSCCLLRVPWLAVSDRRNYSGTLLLHFLLHVCDEIANIGATVQQFVHACEQLFASGSVGICVHCGV